MKLWIIIGTRCLGIVCMLAAVYFDWFRIPMGASGQPHIAWLQNVVKFVFAAAVLSVVATMLQSWSQRKVQTDKRDTKSANIQNLPVFIAASAALIFPGMLRLTCPELMSRAAWLHAQHENLTWHGGDISTAYEHSTSGFKSRVYSVDVPVRVQTTIPATWSLWETRPHHFPLLFAETGYGNVFCQFVKRGWFLGVLGAFCVIFAGLFAGDELVPERLRRTIATGVALATAYLVVMLTPTYAAGNCLRSARVATAEGEYEAATNALDDATSWSRMLPFNSDYQRQRSLLAWRSHKINTASYDLFEAIVFEDEGHFAEADMIYQELLGANDTPLPIQREAARGMLRSAVHALNSDRFEQSRTELAMVKQFEPAHLKANYILQLVALQEGQRERLQSLVTEMEEHYRDFSFPNRKVVLATCQQHLCYAAMREHDMSATWTHFNRYRRP